MVGKPEVERLSGRHRRRWEDNIRMNIREVKKCELDISGLG
jgi:hypothetical protein